MKNVVLMLALAGVVGFAGQSLAGSGCCPASKSAKMESGWGSCSSALSGIELSAEQQDKIAAIEAECKAAGSTPEACSSSMNKIRDVLTDEQKATFDAASAPKKKGGC